MMAEHNVKLWGGRVPREVLNMAKHLKDLDKQLFRRILKCELASKTSLEETADCNEVASPQKAFHNKCANGLIFAIIFPSCCKCIGRQSVQWVHGRYY